jgi:glutamine---fructose-6-phosphate transaminase (isomerizing)
MLECRQGAFPMPTEFDPTAPLPGPPDPWAYASAPSRRDHPPYHLTDMIAAEPALARRIIERVSTAPEAIELANAIRAAVRDGGQVMVTGCGTSETAAMGMVEILRDGLRAGGLSDAVVSSAQAFELALDPLARGLVIGVTHEGGTSATNNAMRASREAGARTAVVTVSRRSPAGSIAEIVIETGELDQSWCHSVGYTSPMLAAAAIAGLLSGSDADADAIAELLAAGGRDEAGAERMAAQVGTGTQLIVVASGADRPAGREFALKVEEASWLPSAYRDLETFLHGHFPATGPDTGLVLLLTDRAGRAERLARARQLLAGMRVIGVRSAAILASALDGELDPDLTPAGRLLVSEAPALPGPVAALFGTATPLQLLTERIARARGTNPDPIRRDDPVYKDAADAAGG